MGSATVSDRRSGAALALAAFMAGAGVAHFVAPGPYEQIVPRALGAAGRWVRLSGMAEIGCAVLLLPARTRRAGAWFTAAVLVAVFPANVKMALDGGIAGYGFPLGSPVVAWLRLPLQIPLLTWAVSVARHAGSRPSATRRSLEVGASPKNN